MVMKVLHLRFHGELTLSLQDYEIGFSSCWEFTNLFFCLCFEPVQEIQNIWRTVGKKCMNISYLIITTENNAFHHQYKYSSPEDYNHFASLTKGFTELVGT